MANTILLKRSSTASAVPNPGDLAAGELALNTADGIIYMKDSGGTVIDVATIRYTDAEKSKLAAIEASATADQSAAEILAALITVDGSGSGIDADMVDGIHGNAIFLADGTVTMTGLINMGSQRITNMADGVSSQDAVTKNQLDSAQAGLLVKDACRVATDAALPAVTAAGSGIGKTLTANAVGVLTVDTIAVELGDRIMVKDQAAGADNGIYEMTTLGTAGVAFVLTRATDYDGNPSGEVTAGTFAFINEGSANGLSGWTLLETGLSGGGSPAIAVLDTDALTFSQFQGLPAYTAGTNLTLTGNDFSVDDAFVSNTGDSIAGNLVPDANNTRTVGASGNVFNAMYATTFYGESTSAQYADLAEIYEADAEIAPGTVVCFGGAKEVTACGHDHDQRVAGIVSTNPAYLMNSDADGVAVALRGRVPCKVSGSIKKGDMLVSDGNGGARAEANPMMGAVIAKALEDSEGEAVIEVVV